MIQSLPALRRQFLSDNKSFAELAEDDPRRVQPLSLEQLKKQAKDLLRQLRNSEAWERMQARHPASEQLSPDAVKLSDAQLVIAREQGFSSWPRLKHHIDAAVAARQALLTDQPEAVDGDKKTLHIRCGNDVMYKLAVAGFAGDFLNFSDPYIQGPVPDTPDLDAFLRMRADFIADNNWRRRQQAYTELLGSYRALEETGSYRRIAFWFEHDAYDVLVFLKLLHFFIDHRRRSSEMRFVCVSHYPGVKRFNGIGQLPPEAMRVLWERFQPIHEEQFQFGAHCWQAYTAATPEAFWQLAKQEDSPLPEIIPALRRHVQELPWRRDGLSLSERLTLQIIHDKGPQDAPTLFYHWYTTLYEPLVFMGDSSYWVLLQQLAQAQRPAIHLQKRSQKVIDWQVSLTDFGRQLLAGKAHWMTHNAYDRWFGGVHNQSANTIWYWDDESKQVVSVLDR